MKRKKIVSSVGNCGSVKIEISVDMTGLLREEVEKLINRAASECMITVSNLPYCCSYLSEVKVK